MPLRTCFVRLCVAAVLLSPADSSADESDQYMVWGVELADAAPLINEHLNGRIAEELERINSSNPGCDCETLTTGVFVRIYQDRFRAELTDFIEATPAIDVYPPRSITPIEIFGRSIYRNALVPLTIRVTRNIRIGDVYLGTDKLNHFFGIGRRYYTRYLAALKSGRTESEAEQDAIAWGLLTESTFLGTTTNGIFSIADLESNYQGFRLAKNLCAGPNPYLIRTDDHWVVQRPIDLRDYINPLYDESFNPSLYLAILKGTVLRILQDEYAAKAALDSVAARFAHYRAALPSPDAAMTAARVFLLEEDPIDAQRAHADLLRTFGITAPSTVVPLNLFAWTTGSLVVGSDRPPAR